MNGKLPDEELEKQTDYIDTDKAEVHSEIIVNNEISNLEKMIKSALLELKDLDNNLTAIFKPTIEDRNNLDVRYLLAVRRFQNAMKVALIDGANNMDLKTFEQGFNFYKSALEIITSMGNPAEIEQVKNEFAQTLIKVLTTTKNVKDKEFIPFAYRACKSLGEIYDSIKKFEISSKFHNRAGALTRENPLLADFEYIHVVLNYILLGDKNQAKIFCSKLKLRHFKIMGGELIQSFIEKDAEAIRKIKNKMETIGAQRSLNVDVIIYLLDLLVKKIIEKKKNGTAVEEIEELADARPLTDEKLNVIKDSLSKGIQQLQTAHPNIQIPVAAKIDTSSIISELKDVISSEITRGINSLSDEIVSKILSKIPTGSVSISPQRPRTAGDISDEGVPEIEIVEGGPTERPQRPKLDDMLDSIIVSE